MRDVTRSFAILGVALVVALFHSWFQEVTLAPPEPDTGKELVVSPGTTRPADQGSPTDVAGDQSTDTPPVTNPQGPDETGPVADTPPRAAQIPPPTAFSTADIRGKQFITFEQTLWLLNFVESAQVVFIDARHDADAYAAGHIPSAIRLSADMFDDLDPVAEEFYINTPQDTRLVIYCGGGDCDESINTASRLTDRGFTVYHIFKGGWQEWSAGRGPVVTGEEPGFVSR